MKHLPCLLPALIAFAAAAPAQDQPAPAAAVAAQKVDTKVERAYATGDKLEMSVKAAISRSADWWHDGVQAPASSENKEFAAEGTMEITAVTPNSKRPTAFKFTVKKFTMDSGSGVKTLFKEGAVVECKAEKDKQAEFKVDGGDVDDELTVALLVTLPDAGAEDVSAEDVFGPGGPRALNEEWTFDPKKLCSYSEAVSAVTADPANSSGSAKFTRLTEAAGKPGVVLSTRIVLAVTGAPGLPEKAKIEKGSATMEQQTTLPLDPSSVEAASRYIVDRDLNFTLPVEDGDPVKMRLRDHLERKITQKKL